MDEHKILSVDELCTLHPDNLRKRLAEGWKLPMAGGMPYEGLGARHNAVATKGVQHGAPVVEDKLFAGIAFKSTNAQGIPYVDPILDAPASASLIAVGEAFVIQIGGMHQVASALLGAAVVGDPVWINVADNTLVLAAAAGHVKFGVIDSFDIPDVGFALINAELRDQF